MAPASESSTGPLSQDVSPELIAEITDRVKKELVEHLKQNSGPESRQKTPPLQPTTEDTVKDTSKSATVEDDPDEPPLHRAPSTKSQSSTSSPPPTVRRVYTPPSPTRAPKPSNVVPPQSSHASSPSGSPRLDRPSGVRFSDRPLPRPGRSFSTMELSTIDQKWGRLFDNEGNPTQRLGQFLRGLANHIIEEFPAKKSIVVPPSKMAAFYASHALEKETHPLLSMFRAQSNAQISRLYQILGCEHHLIQDHPSNAPTIPALTPVGFAHWMTIHILAYPEEEAKRLEQVVLALPINADGVVLDGRPERLPKQISRYLLPAKEDIKSRKWVDNAISDFFNDLGTTSRHRASTSPIRHSSTRSRSRPAETHDVKTTPIAPVPRPVERQRSPYPNAPSTSGSPSNEDAVKIERDRQPYTAQPGSGRVFTESSSLNTSKLGRANSTSHTKNKREAPESRHHRTQSTAAQTYAATPRASTRNPHSPPLKSYSDSIPDDLGGYQNIPPLTPASSSYTSQSQPFGPSSYESTGSIPPPPPTDRDRRTRDDHHYWRGTDDDARFATEFNSPRDAERWDRILESRSGAPDYKEYRPSVPVDSRDPRTGGYEDWYRVPGTTRY